METRAIPQSRIPHTSRLFQDFLCDYPRVSRFYPAAPFDIESFRLVAQTLHYPEPLRASVAAVLRDCNQRFNPGPETLHSLERFTQPGCVAVVTGQQVGLFTGPAFALYKALTAVKLARSLAAQGIEAVPIFWLATEDHDLAEVNHCFVQDRSGAPQRLEYAVTPPVPHAPAGAVRLTEEILPLIDSLREMLPDAPPAREIVDMVSACYRPGAGLGEAFGGLIARLFSSHGVLLIDSLDARLHRLSAPIYRTAIEQAGAIHDELIERNRLLAQAGYHAQVHVGESQSTLFVYEDGQRTALRLEDGRFHSSLGRTYRSEELLAMLKASPELFSPNVLLRPVVQDALLPTVAYVGGPSEVAYLAQTAPLYQRVFGKNERGMPVVYPRANFTLLDPASARLLGKYGMSLEDVFAGPQPLREKMATRFLPEGLTGLFEKAAANLNSDFEAIKAGLDKLDRTLVDAATHSAQKMQYQLTHLEHKAAAAAQKRSDQVERDAQRLENSLYPEKTLQERLYSGISLMARFGLPLLDQLYERISLDSADHQVLAP